MANRSFVKGAMILGAAAIVSKLLGSVYTILLQNLIGDRGMGIYQMAYPIYATLLIVSTAGFPVAVSKFVSEHAAVGDLDGARKIYRVSLLLLTLIGAVSMVLLYVGAGFFAAASGDLQAVYAIRAIAPALLIVPAMSSMRGYFQGWQIMEPTAVSQVVEQFVRVLTILVGAYAVIHFGFGDSMAAAAAAFGAVSGAVAGIGVMVYYLGRHRNGARWNSSADRGYSNRGFPDISTRTILRRLLYYAVPVSLGALIIPIISNVDALTVTNLLKGQGIPQALATQEFGILSGRAFKLMMFPAALASSIGAALLPSVSQAYARSDHRDTVSRIVIGLRMTILFALPASVGIFLLAQPIDIALFKNSAGFHSIQIMGFAILFSALQITSAASLQGMGAVYLPLRSLLIGTLLKVALNLTLVPHWGIDGAAFATVVSYSVAGLLNGAALARKLHLHISFSQHLWKPIIAVFPMGAFLFALLSQWERLTGLELSRGAAMTVTVVAVFSGMVIYLIMLLLLGALREDEVASVPRLGPILVRTFHRMGLLSG